MYKLSTAFKMLYIISILFYTSHMYYVVTPITDCDHELYFDNWQYRSIVSYIQLDCPDTTVMVDIIL